MTTQQQAARRKRNERGASLVEYVLLLSLIAIVCLASVAYLGGTVRGRLDSTASTVHAATSSP